MEEDVAPRKCLMAEDRVGEILVAAEDIKIVVEESQDTQVYLEEEVEDQAEAEVVGLTQLGGNEGV